MSSPNFHHPVSFCSALLFFLALITPIVISCVPRGRNVVLLIFNIWNIDIYVQEPNSYFLNEWVYTRGCASIYFHLFNQLFQAPFLVQVLWAYIERHPPRCQEAAYFRRDRNGMDLEKICKYQLLWETWHRGYTYQCVASMVVFTCNLRYSGAKEERSQIWASLGNFSKTLSWDKN